MIAAYFKQFTIRMFGAGVMIAVVVSALGCPQQRKDAPQVSHVDESTRPPLRVMLIGCPSLQETIELRWKSASQQPLAISVHSVDEFIESSSISADVVVYPAFLLGELVQRQSINPLPKRLILESDAANHGIAKWPAHWHRLASYGKKPWGIVLGSPLPVVIHSASSGLKDLRVESLLAIPPSGQSSGRSLNQRIEPSEEDLLCNFLLMVACVKSDSANLGAFFHLSDMRSRLAEKEFRQAAELMIRLDQQLPGGIGQPANRVWDGVLGDAMPWGIGRPGPKSLERADAASDGHQVGLLNAARLGDSQSSDRSSGEPKGGVTVDPGQGLMVSQSALSRQSSVSTFFLEWIDDEEQRMALHRVSELVVPTKAENASRVGIEAAYDRICRNSWSGGSIPLELRLAGSIQYRRRLVQAIRNFLKNPERVEEELKACSEDWDKITIASGLESQRKSAEQSYLLSE